MGTGVSRCWLWNEYRQTGYSLYVVLDSVEVEWGHEVSLGVEVGVPVPCTLSPQGLGRLHWCLGLTLTGTLPGL